MKRPTGDFELSKTFPARGQLCFRHLPFGGTGRRNFTQRLLILVAISVAGSYLLKNPAEAGTITWANAGTNFETGANWGGTAPANDTTTDLGVFNSLVTNQPALTADRSIAGLKFTTPTAGGWNLSGGFNLTLGNGITGETNGINSANTSGTNTVSVGGIILGVNQNWSVSGGGTLAVGSNITGSGTLNKMGSGKLILSGTNSYLGATTITSGNLQFNSLASIGGTGRSITVNSSNSPSAVAGFAINQGFLDRITLASTGAVALGVDSSNNLDFTGFTGLFLGANGGSVATPITYNGVITPNANVYRLGGGGGVLSLGTQLTGNRSVEFRRNGSVILTNGSNDYTGATTIFGNIGTDQLILAHANALGNTSSTEVGGNQGYLGLQGGITITGKTLLMSSTNAAPTLASLSGNNAWTSDITVSTVTGAGFAAAVNTTLTLGNINSTVTGAGNYAAISLTPSNATPNSRVIVNGIISGNARLITGNASSQAFVELNGDNTYTGTTTLGNATYVITTIKNVGATSSSLGAPSTPVLGTISFGASNWSGGLKYIGTGDTTDRIIHLAGGAGQNGILDQSGMTGLLKFTSDTTSTANNKSLVLTGSTDGTGEFAGKIVNSLAPSIGVRKEGTGKWTLSGANTYSGATAITAGILQITNNSALGDFTGGTTVSSGASLELAGGITVGTEALSLTGTGISNGGALRNVSGNNDFGGLITLVTSAARINSDAGTLTLSNPGNITGGFALTVGGAGNTNIASGINTGSGTFTKDGAGKVTLSNTNTFTGNKSITGGTLEIDSTGTINGAGTLTINGADANFKYNSFTAYSGGNIILTQGTISGTGAINKLVTVGPNGIVSPGNSPGTQAYVAGQTWNNGGTYKWEINNWTGGSPGNDFDQLQVFGAALNISGLTAGSWPTQTFKIDITGLNGSNVNGAVVGFNPAVAGSWDIVTYFAGLSGTFDASLFTLDTSNFTNFNNIGGGTFSLSDTGSSLRLTFTPGAVPEPSSFALAGLALVGFGAFLRRKWRSTKTPG